MLWILVIDRCAHKVVHGTLISRFPFSCADDFLPQTTMTTLTTTPAPSSRGDRGGGGTRTTGSGRGSGRGRGDIFLFMVKDHFYIILSVDHRQKQRQQQQEEENYEDYYYDRDDSYGAPKAPSSGYNAPAPAPSYKVHNGKRHFWGNFQLIFFPGFQAPAPSYEAPAPSYEAPAPSYKVGSNVP